MAVVWSSVAAIASVKEAATVMPVATTTRPTGSHEAPAAMASHAPAMSFRM
jgi:hypothetical protein